MQLPFQGDEDKWGLGYKGRLTSSAITQIHEIQDEGYYEESPSSQKGILFDVPYSPLSQCVIHHFIFK